jgi:hypothetical protein
MSLYVGIAVGRDSVGAVVTSAERSLSPSDRVLVPAALVIAPRGRRAGGRPSRAVRRLRERRGVS